MRTITKIWLILLIATACSEDDNKLKPDKKLETDKQDEPVAKIIFCQSSPNDTLKKIEYDYENSNLIKEITLQNGEIVSTTMYEYNSDNQKIKEVTDKYRRKIAKTFIYNDLDQLIEIEYTISDYDTNGVLVDTSKYEETYVYENGLLIKEREYWGGLVTYEYTNRKLTKKIEYTKIGQKHHITTYEYSDDLLIEEIKKTRTGSIIYNKTFYYDSKDRLIIVKDGENIIKENFYSENKLIETRKYYYGIDPCYDICCGNYIYRYEY